MGVMDSDRGDDLCFGHQQHKTWPSANRRRRVPVCSLHQLARHADNLVRCHPVHRWVRLGFLSLLCGQVRTDFYIKNLIQASSKKERNMPRKTKVVYALCAVYWIVWLIIVSGYYSRLDMGSVTIIAIGAFAAMYATLRGGDWRVDTACALLLGLGAIEVYGLLNLIPTGDFPGAAFMCNNALLPAVLGGSTMSVVRLITEKPTSSKAAA
jgi:hypothetical protein